MFSHPEAFKKDFIQLILLTVGAYIVEYWFFVYKADIQVINDEAELLHSDIHLVLTIGKFFVFFGYFFATMRLFRQHQHFIKENFSNTKHYDLKWVRNMLFWNGLLISYALIAFILSYIFDGFTIGKSNMTAYWVLILYIYYASVNGFRQKDIHIEVTAVPVIENYGIISSPEIQSMAEPQPDLPEITLIEPRRERAKYQRSKLSGQDAHKIINKVILALEKEELFLEPELTLRDLADKTKEPTYLISQSLNQSMGKSFYDLINNYRVEKAKQLLTDPNKQHLTVLSIAFEAGFNSKTTFNNVFKKLTGTTPTEFMKSKTRQLPTDN